MEEELLQFIWYRQVFRLQDLITTDSEPVLILNAGIQNYDQGPDFLNARIRIGNHVWIGNVEIHTQSSFWNSHHHHTDPHYNNVILHVVWNEDEKIKTDAGFAPPCITLADRVDMAWLDYYRNFIREHDEILCGRYLPEVSSIVKQDWLERMTIERLEEKTKLIERIFHECKQNWEKTFWTALARQLGAPVNGDAMEQLLIRTPYEVLLRHIDKPAEVESILFGMAGMLDPAFEQEYPKQLQKMFRFYRIKYRIAPMREVSWLFLRMRPANFPTLRIAQIASLICMRYPVIRWIDERMDPKSWIKHLRISPGTDYWNDHYHLTSTSHSHDSRLGVAAANGILINVIAPFSFYYFRQLGRIDYHSYAISLWESMSVEDNKILRSWKDHGWVPGNAADGQGMLHLKKTYCEKRHCLRCRIGTRIMSSGHQ